MGTIKCSAHSYKLLKAAPDIIAQLPQRRHATFKAAETVSLTWAATASFLSRSIATHPAYRFLAWRHPSRRASPESAPWPSRWETSPPWAELSYTPPVLLGMDGGRGGAGFNRRRSFLWPPRGEPLTILLLISWKWISQTFSTTSSFSNVTNPNPDERRNKNL